MWPQTGHTIIFSTFVLFRVQLDIGATFQSLHSGRSLRRSVPDTPFSPVHGQTRVTMLTDRGFFRFENAPVAHQFDRIGPACALW